MRYLIFSDAHGHLAAVQELMEKAKHLKFDKVCCLGDSVGSGGNSEEVLNLLIPWIDEYVCGNHEYMESCITSPVSNFNGVNSYFSRAIFSKKSQDFFEFIKNKKSCLLGGNILLSHGDPRNDFFSYLYLDTLGQNRSLRTTLFSKEERSVYNEYFGRVPPEETIWDFMTKAKVKICFMGHTHVPGVVVKDRDGEFHSSLNPKGVFDFLDSDYILVNVGSCASPREGKDSTFVIFDSDKLTIEFHSLSYKFVRQIFYPIAAEKNYSVYTGVWKNFSDRK